MTLYSAFRNYFNFQVTWCLGLVFREICAFLIDFYTEPNAIESSSKLLKQSPVIICCESAALLKRYSGAVVSL